MYICPANKILTTTGKLVNDGETLLYRTKARDCRGCLLKAQCCPKTSVHKIPRSVELGIARSVLGEFRELAEKNVNVTCHQTCIGKI